MVNMRITTLEGYCCPCPHGYWLKDCFCSIEGAVSAWNKEMTRIWI